LNDKTESHRTQSGRLDSDAGTSHDLNEFAHEFVGSSDRAGLISQAESIVAGLKGHDAENAEWYVKYMRAIEKRGNDFITSEKERLEGLLNSRSAAGTKLDEFNIRQNVLNKF